MKFETKYLIRWGIPGWVLIFWIFYHILFLKEINPLDSNLVNITKGLTLFISLAALGVPLGYLLHQIYFGIIWVFNRNRKFAKDFAEGLGDKFNEPTNWGQNRAEAYYEIEYIWHSMLLDREKEEERTYLEGRYRYLLSTIHGLGSLFVSSAISLVICIPLAMTLYDKNISMTLYFIIGLIFQLAIFIFSMGNYNYYSNNLKAFQIKMLKKYL